METPYKDKNGTIIKVGDILLHDSIDGEPCEFKVRYSDYRNDYIGDCPTEIYDLSSKLFAESEIKTAPAPESGTTC